MDYELSTDPARMQLDVIHGYLATSYWSPGIRRELVAEAIRNSLVLGVFERASGAQVAFARVVTDYATFAYLCDVFVLESHRGRGLSKRMVEHLLAHPRLQTLRRWCLATRDAHELYRRYGFEDAPAGRWMDRRSAAAAWQDTGFVPHQ
jgi:GNAT superfamily N-acetyltransferase